MCWCSQAGKVFQLWVHLCLLLGQPLSGGPGLPRGAQTGSGATSGLPLTEMRRGLSWAPAVVPLSSSLRSLAVQGFNGAF